MTLTEVLSKPRLKVSQQDSDEERARRKMVELHEWIEQRKKELAQSTKPCTVCGKTAKYTRDGGWMQGAYHVYICNDDHESAYQGDQGRTLKS